MSAFKALGLDPKMFKHVKSDHKSTTLQHKQGHVVTIAHNVLSPKMQTQLKALANVGKEDQTEAQSQEAQDQQPRKMAEGGKTMPSELGDGSPMPMMAEGGHPPCLNPNCSSKGQSHPNCKCYGGNMAEGGKPKSRCASRQAHDPGCQYYTEGSGVSPQGQMIRHNTELDKRHAKDEAKGRMEHERMIKPKMQGLADGGEAKEQNETQIIPDKGYGKIIRILAEGGEVLHEGPMTPDLHKAMSPKMYADPEGPVSKDDSAPQADPDQVMTPMNQGHQPQAPVNININSGPQPQAQSQAPQESGPEMLKRRIGDAGNFIRKAVVGEPIGPDGMPVQPQAKQQQSQGMAPQRAPAAVAPQPQQQPQAEQPQPALPPQPQPQAAMSMPAGPPRQAVEPDPFTQTRDAAITDMSNEKNAWGQDLKDGHITPKTYESLFADKSTTGKIGTIFGMLMSGAGSGLAHQSNAVIDMMNTQIKNDLQAQEKSKDNAQNYLKLAQQHELAKSQSKVLTADAALKAKALANIYMNQAALHKLVGMAGTLPTGSPEWQRAQQGLAMLSGQIDNADLNLMDRAAIGQAQFNSFANPAQGQGNSDEAFNQQQKQRLLMGPKGQAMAQFSALKHLPGFEGEAARDIPNDIQNQVAAQKQYEEKAKEYVDFAKKHQNNWANLDLRQRASIANQGAAMGANLQSLYRNKIKGGVYKKGEQEFIEQIIPDNPASWQASFKHIPKVEQTIKDNTGDLRNTVKSLGDSLKFPDSNMVTVVSPQGTVGKIPKANLEKALKFGYKQQ